jgi:hypothetical protein
VGSNLKRLLRQAKDDSHKPQSFILAKGGALPKPDGISAGLIDYGFKAPVAMTLNPWWHELLPNYKFLHVVRDGRDIAFSANQGPVQKFYKSMYQSAGDLSLPAPVKAVKLWSDWNVQIQKWAKDQVNSLDKELMESNLENSLLGSTTEDSIKSLGYFLLHSEDLVSQSVAVKFTAMSQLAEWVGSTATEDEICCMAVVDSEFMGSHDRTNRDAKSNSGVTARYGKWRNFVKNDRNLEKLLHDRGKEGLELFGYMGDKERPEPEIAVSKSGFICNKTRYQCGVPEPPKPVDINSFPKKTILDGACDVIETVDFKGPDLVAAAVDSKDLATTAEACCQLCQRDPHCLYFTLDNSNNMCYLKSSPGSVTDGHKLLTSGVVKKH